MAPDSRAAILQDIRHALGRTVSSSVGPRPSIPAPRKPGAQMGEIERFVEQVTALTGKASRLTRVEVPTALASLVLSEGIQKAVVAGTSGLDQLGIAEQLSRLRVRIIPHSAAKEEMAEADLGITEADFLLPETGTLGLLSAPLQPRAVSLLPRVHLAIVRPQALRADLIDVFRDAKAEQYLVLISGPSRTSDIEMNVTVGVHGPQVLYVWILEEAVPPLVTGT